RPAGKCQSCPYQKNPPGPLAASSLQLHHRRHHVLAKSLAIVEGGQRSGPQSDLLISNGNSTHGLPPYSPPEAPGSVTSSNQASKMAALVSSRSSTDFTIFLLLCSIGNTVILRVSVLGVTDSVLVAALSAGLEATQR